VGHLEATSATPPDDRGETATGAGRVPTAEAAMATGRGTKTTTQKAIVQTRKGFLLPAAV
jgi:hypothetical protein